MTPPRFEAVKARRPKRLTEPLDRKPYDLFFFESAGHTFVGQKFEYPHQGPEGEVLLKSAMVTPEMTLGLFEGARHTEDHIELYFRPLHTEEKEGVFREFRAADRELRYPYVHLSTETKKERCAPASYWTPSAARAEHLNLGEQFLREHAFDVIEELRLKGGLAYDPACSTGEFLGSFKARFPQFRAVGQDASPEMVAHAKARDIAPLDEVHLGDALHPCVSEGSADLMFVRFLNVDVVGSARAQTIFARLARCCKPGGRIIVLGHTPILLTSAWFEMQGLEIERRLGLAPRGATFQFYVLRRPV